MTQGSTGGRKVASRVLLALTVLLVAGVVVVGAMGVSRTGAETGAHFNCGRPLSMTKGLNDDGQFVCKPALHRRREIMAGLGIVAVLAVVGAVASQVGGSKGQ